MNLELCTDCVEGAILAGRYGFQRIELCSALSEGGLTPSWGMIQSCAEASPVEIHAMIRTRGGSFTCSDPEMRVMEKDIEAVCRAGAKGVVFGILEPEKEIDQRNRGLVELAHSLGMQATFHRAFDQVCDPEKAIERILGMGFDRLLTSGLKSKAIEGIDLIRHIHQKYGNRIQIMAGSGINPENALSFAEAGLEHLHFTARKNSENHLMDGMGFKTETDEAKIRAMRDIFP